MTTIHNPPPKEWPKNVVIPPLPKAGDKYHEGICMMCHKSPIQVRHIDLYLIGSEGFGCCKGCENEVLEFIREKSRKVIREALKTWKERKHAKR